METIEGNNITAETLTGVSSHIPSKPTPEEIFGTDLASENGTTTAAAAGEVVVTTVVETTEVTVVKVVQENKDDTLMFQDEGEEAFNDSAAEKTDNNNNGAKENEKQGAFSHLFDGDEGMNVNYNNNNEAKANEKEAVFDHLFDGGEDMHVDYNNNEAKEKDKEGGFGNLLDGDEGINVNVTESEDLMDVCLPDQKDEKPDNSLGVFEFTEDINEKENLENLDNGIKLAEKNENEIEEDEEEEEEEEHDYVVGDFVWGKIKSHPWWPGQIFDPIDASDYANSIKKKGHLLVAYFGDGSFSWCSPSQLKPFVDHFQEMSTQSDSKKFVHAVKTALESVSNLVESELTGKCQTADRAVVNADVANSGIKPGVEVPKGNTVRVLIDRMSTIELLMKLDAYATFEPGLKMVELELDLTMVKSWLSVFYFKKGGYLLPEYHDPKCIEGLEDKSRVGTGIGIGDSEVNGPSECGENGDDKLYNRRKQKSVAELLSVEDEPKTKKAKAVRDSGGSGRKRKAALVVSVVESPESDGGGSNGGVEEDAMYSPRQRKKSKYLSPPYLSPVWTGAGKLSGSGSGSFKEPKPEPEKEKDSETAAKQPDETSSKKKPRQKKSSNDKDEGKIVIDGNVNVDQVLTGLLVVALDPTSSVEKKKISAVTRFVSSFRSSVFENGLGFKPDPETETETEMDVGFVKRKIEEMREIVGGCEEEDEMSEEVKGNLKGVVMEVLERVKK